MEQVKMELCYTDSHIDLMRFMMGKTQAFLLPWILIVLCASLAACQNFPLSEKEIAFQDKYSDQAMNKKMHFWIGEEVDKLRIGEPLTLLIENKTKSTLHFTIDNDIQILFYNDEKREWNEVKNKAVYSSTKVLILPVGPDSPGINEVTLLPDITSSGQSVEIRIVVFGTFAQDNSAKEETSISYVDVTLQP